MTQEKKNRLLFISLIVMMSLSIGLYVADRSEDHGVDRNVFRIENPQAVDRVLLRAGDDSVDIKFSGSGWVVNDSLKADAGMIKVLMATLMQQEAMRHVGARLNDSLSRWLEVNGVRVTVFKAGEVAKDFYAGGNAGKTRAYFRETESETVYVMAIPGYRVYVAGIYELDAGGFRDKYVFGFRWENFRRMSVRFPSRPADGFNVVLEKGGRYFVIGDLQQTDTARLNSFLTDVSLLKVDEFARPESADPVVSRIPLMEIIVEDHASRKYPLEIFPFPRDGMVPAKAGNESVYFQPAKIRGLLRPRSFFEKQ